MRLGWFFAFFLVSGFCSLVYEVVWLRLAMASFGVTTPLVSIVLSVFMAGLALGSWLVGRLARRLRDAPPEQLLRLYAAAELVIASGLVVPSVLEAGRALLAEVGRGVWGSGSYYLASGAWIAVSLLPFTVAMGATFPLAMAAIRKSLSEKVAERSFSYLYFANVAGATLGTITSAFFMIELLGFQGTLRVTALLNVLLAASAFAASRVSGSATPVSHRPTGVAPLAMTPPSPMLLWLLFLGGFASMAMEVVWIRQFTPYLGTVVYAFAAILAVYLAATFLGSRAYRALACGQRTNGESRVWAAGWPLLGLLGLLPLIGADPRLPFPSGVLEATGRVAFGIMPFCAAVGALTPMLVDRWSHGDPDRAGRAYAVNVLGSILGPLVAGFALLPALGERWTLLALAALLFAVGALVSLPRVSLAGLPTRFPVPLFVGAAALALLVAVGTRDFETRFSQRVVRRDEVATVIATGEGMHKRLLVNGIGMTRLTPITKMMAHLPLAYHPAPPRNGLILCFGMGTSFRSLLSWGIEATAVELVPSIPSLFDYYHADGSGLLRSPRARIVIDDSRRFLERTPERYDVITIDPPPPVEAAGSSLLYSREFYALVKKHLQADGIVQQWLPGGDKTALAAVARALDESFPFVRAFPSLEGWGLHFLASMKPLDPAPVPVLARRLPPAAVSDLLEWGPAPTAEQQFQTVAGRGIPIQMLIAGAPDAPTLEDDRPVNEYFLLRRVRERL